LCYSEIDEGVENNSRHHSFRSAPPEKAAFLFEVVGEK